MLKNSVQLSSVVFGFLATLSEEQLEALVNEKAKLKLDYGSEARSVKKPAADIEHLCAFLKTVETREKAKTHFEELRIDKSTLLEVAKHYNIPLMSKDSKAQLLDKIIEATVGSRLRSDAIFRTKLKN